MLRRTLAVVLTIVAVLAAGWLALRRADIPYDTLETAYSLPQTQFLTLQDGLKVHYTDTGPKDRSTLVLVHGFSASLHTWEAWRNNLDQDFRVITLDLPGHGLSRTDPPEQVGIDRFVEVVVEVADKLDAPTFTLVGNSMGGNTAWKTALAHPERIEGLVLIAASGWPETAEESESSPLIFTLLANPIARSVIKDIDMTSLVRSGLEDSYTDQSFVTDELVQRYVDLSRAPGHRETLLTITAGEREPATPAALSMIDAPTLVLWGSDDNLVPASHAQKFADAIPNSKMIVYDGIGHLPQEEAAAQSIADIRTFMMDVEWQSLEDEVVESAGDPRLVEDRASREGG